VDRSSATVQRLEVGELDGPATSGVELEDGPRPGGRAGSADGDVVARFEAVFERHYGAVLGYALRRAASREDAEELTASTFATAWRRIDRLPPEPYARTWLFRVVWRMLANHRRAGDRQTRLLERIGCLVVVPTVDERDPDEDGRLSEAFARLRARDQEVLRLVAWEELSYGEAAAVLGCTPNAFAVRLHRARGALRQELAALGGDGRPDRRAGRPDAPRSAGPAFCKERSSSASRP
jgi:RNA polymerase sigma factor (sigma-70 family)